jgi:hypothetical protein
VKAYAKWTARIPAVYRGAVLDETSPQSGVTIERDPHCLSTLKHFRSLMPLAQEARRPMFFLKPADGAIGGHAKAVQDCYGDFRTLAREIATRGTAPGPGAWRSAGGRAGQGLGTKVRHDPHVHCGGRRVKGENTERSKLDSSPSTESV